MTVQGIRTGVAAPNLWAELIGSCALKTRFVCQEGTDPSRLTHGVRLVEPESPERARRRQVFLRRVEREVGRAGARVSGVDTPAAPEPATSIFPALTRPDTASSDAADRATGCPPDRDLPRTTTMLLRAADAAEDSARYHPVLIVWHKVLDRRPQRGPDTAGSAAPWESRPLVPAAGVLASPLATPDPTRARRQEGVGLRWDLREADFLQLAHTWHDLQQHGLASDEAVVGIVGTDCVPASWLSTDEQPVGSATVAASGDEEALGVVWVSLSEPMVRTFSRSSPDGWRHRSLLERYDHESGFRRLIVESLQNGGTAPTLEPVAVSECARCPWRRPCWQVAPNDDLSQRLGAGRLDVREVRALRRHRIRTIADLAAADLTWLESWYLPEVTHRDDARQRLVRAVRRAGMMIDGRAVERETAGPIEVPTAAVQIDLDIESAPQGAVYLWGFRVASAGDEPRYVEFSRFIDLSPAEEVALARSALQWLRDQVAAAPSVRVYHYSAYERAAIGALAAAHPQDPLLRWATEYATREFVDLYEIVRKHFFGANGLGLKQIAPCAGFRWRDPSPGGLNSQRWFSTAVHSADPAERAAAIRRVMEYNEDDVAATAALRSWLLTVA